MKPLTHRQHRKPAAQNRRKVPAFPTPIDCSAGRSRFISLNSPEHRLLQTKNRSERKRKQLPSRFVMDFELVPIDDVAAPDAICQDFPGSDFRLLESRVQPRNFHAFAIKHQLRFMSDMKIEYWHVGSPFRAGETVGGGFVRGGRTRGCPLNCTPSSEFRLDLLPGRSRSAALISRTKDSWGTQAREFS